MHNLKKAMRLFGLGVLIVLATLGVGISGGVPIAPNKKREDFTEDKTELVEGKNTVTILGEVKN